MDILLIRHGISTGNGKQRLLGWTDYPLTAQGRAQAQAVADRLAPLGPMPVLCSDLARTRETAEIIAARWGGAVTPDPCWRELHCGIYADCSWDTYTGDADLMQRMADDPLGTPLPEGESLNMLIARVAEGFAAVRTRPEPRLAIVSHDGPIRALLFHLLQLPAVSYWTLATSHCGLTRLEVTEAFVSIRTVNDTGHLEPQVIPPGASPIEAIL